jgi:hypothetical protein
VKSGRNVVAWPPNRTPIDCFNQLATALLLRKKLVLVTSLRARFRLQSGSCRFTFTRRPPPARQPARPPGSWRSFHTTAPHNQSNNQLQPAHHPIGRALDVVDDGPAWIAAARRPPDQLEDFRRRRRSSLSSCLASAPPLRNTSRARLLLFAN